MTTAATIAHWVIRVTGVTQVALGLLFWHDRALTLIPLHLLIGATFVLALWELAALAAWAGLPRVLVALAAGWGLLIPVFGMTQGRLLPGSAHWIVEVMHLLIGVAGMVVAARLARYARDHTRAHRRGRPIETMPSAERRTA